MGLTFDGMVLNGITMVSRPDVPTIGTATATSATSATVSFTAPLFDGGATITSYTAVSSPDGITGTLSQSGSGTITVNGLTPGQSYTFSVYATNSEGNSDSSSASNQVTVQSAVGQVAWTSPAAVDWTVPAGVTSISILTVGGGGAGYWGSPSASSFNRGGGGGALAYVNNISVTPGEILTIGAGNRGTNTTAGVNGTSGELSVVIRRSNLTTLCRANGGNAATSTTAGAGGTVHTGTGGVGGNGSSSTVLGFGTGGGGAGGYSGKGGNGGSSGASASTPGNGLGGGGGGGCGYKSTSGATGSAPGASGGGVGIYGEGTSGAGGVPVTSKSPPNPGNPGSGGSTVTFGAGGGGVFNSSTGVGAVRIIWPGDARYFPSTRTTDE